MAIIDLELESTRTYSESPGVVSWFFKDCEGRIWSTTTSVECNSEDARDLIYSAMEQM